MSMHKGKCGIWYHEATQAENSMQVNDSYHICQEKLKHSHCTQTDAVLWHKQLALRNDAAIKWEQIKYH